MAAQTGVTVQIGGTVRTYRLWVTTAPAVYDYGDTLHVYGDPAESSAVPHRERSERLVLIPSEREADQTTRYRSGLYPTEPSALLPATGQGGLEDVLWTALRTLHRGQD